MAYIFAGQLFELGQIVITKGASLHLSPTEVWGAIGRHATGDWGGIDEEDRAANDLAIVEGTRILSAYRDLSGVRFWIITEGDRSVTTVLEPSDY